MENFGLDKREVENLVKELTQGRELAKQLQVHLDHAQSSSHESRELLLHQIILSYDNVLSKLKPSNYNAATSNSPLSLVGSPHSDESDPDFNKDQSSRKRKGVSSIWTEKVKVCTSTGGEEQLLDDGYGWRKYGQKDILGAKYPRGYYRCSNRHGQGCLATKQVQRSDDDPTTFEITYRRKHTCNPRASPTHPVPVPIPSPQNKDPNPDPLTQSPQQLVSRSEQNGPLFNIQTSLRVIPLDLGPNQNPSSDPFNFHASSTINLENNNIFTDGNYNNLGNYSPNILSPAASGLGYFPINDNYGGGLTPSLHALESELSPIVAVMTSSTSSPTLGTNFGFESSEFGSSFGFGNPEF